jgi:DnaJ-class molecular chaperone
MTDKQKLHEAFDELEYDDEYICPACSGSGEGMWDGSTCRKCKGTGGYPKQYRNDDYE